MGAITGVATGSLSGYIGYNLLTYDVHANAEGLVTGFIGLAGYYITRAYISMDTSTIPDDATIESATLQLYFYGMTSGGPNLPSTWVHTLYIGANVIGASLDQTDWGAAGFKNNGNYTPAEGLVEIPIASNMFTEISKDGYTDFEVRDSSTAMGSGTWSITFYMTSPTRGAKLIIWYSQPDLNNCKLYNCKIFHA